MKIIDDITDFIFINSEPEKADAAFVVGGSFPEAAEIAADLWKKEIVKYVIIGGGVSIKTGCFPGPKSKQNIYNKQYETEFEFYKDVLLINGVDENSIFGENCSAYTKQNAEFAKRVVIKNNLIIGNAIIICKSFHARRCLMFYQSYFPNIDFSVITFDGFGISKDNWFKSDYGIQRVVGELKRCGEQISIDDINAVIKSNNEELSGCID